MNVVPLLTSLSTTLSWNRLQLPLIDFVVNQIALDTIGNLAFSLGVAYFCPPVFGIGLVIGFVFHHQVKYVLRDVQNIFTKDDPNIPSYWKKVADIVKRLSFLTFYMLLNMPASLLTATLYFSTQWGVHFRYRAQQQFNSP